MHLAPLHVLDAANFAVLPTMADRARVDRVLVIVYSRPEDLIPASVRADMLRELHPDTTVVVTPDDIPDTDAEATSRAWAARTLALSAAVFGHGPDVAFTSEEYGPRFARHLGARHVAIDPGRSRFPISGTAVCVDPWAAADFLAPCVLAWFVRRVCVVDAESTGTTTLCRDLAGHYGCDWVPEYGRQYCGTSNGPARTSSISPGGSRPRGRLHRLASARLRYRCAGHRGPARALPRHAVGAAVERLAAARSYALYILTGDDIPFVQDDP